MPTSCRVRSMHSSLQSSHSSWNLQHLQKISKRRIVALMTLCPSLFWVFCPQLKLATDLVENIGKELLGPEKRDRSSASYDEYSGNHDQFDSLPFLEKFSNELTDPTVTPSPVAVRPFPPTAKQLSLFNTVWIGALASCSAELSSYPFDFAKTRLQIQSDAIDKLKKGAPSGVPSSIASRWTGMMDVLVRAPQLSPRGIWVLFDGLTPAILRQATYGTIKIASYEKLKTMLEDKLPPVQCALLAGAAAGALSSAICTPTDLVKVRMAGGDRPDYTSIREGLRLIVKEEGWMALYKGVVPTTQRAMVVTLLNLPTYDIAKLYLMDWHYSDTVTTHFLAGTFAGLFSTIGSNPIDTVKSRIMNQPVDERGKGLLYRNSWHCTVKTVRDEGFAALWKGSVPNCCRNVPWLVIFWCTYEALKKLAEEDKKK